MKRIAQNTKICLIALYTLLFFLLCYILHYFMHILSDDLYFMHYLDNQSVIQFMFWNYCDGVGRILTDTFGSVLTNIPFQIWKTLDTFFYCFAAILLSAFICFFDSKTTYGFTFYLPVSCLLIICFPIRYLASAGYIVTSANYIYTTFCILACLVLLCLPVYSNSQHILYSIIAFFLASYAGSQEQSACVFLALLFGLFLYRYYNKETINYLVLFVELLSCLVVIIIVLSSPAHTARANTTDSPFSVPGYANWSITTKLFKGFTTTTANLLFCPCSLYYIFIVLLFLSSIQNNMPSWRKALALVPCLESTVIYIIGSEHFVFYPEYGFGMPDLRNWFLGDESHIFTAISIIIILSVISSIFASQDSIKNSIVLLYSVAVAFVSRIIMGFSSTLFGSSFRTFTYLLSILMFIDLFLIKELFRKNSKALYAGVTVIILLSIISYSRNFQWIVFGIV